MWRRRTQRKVITYVCAALGILFLAKIYWTPSADWIFEDLRAAQGGGGNGHDEQVHTAPPKHEKWVVVTTIQRPTAALRALAILPGWKLIVVADRKTPAGWSMPDENVVYLDLDAQKALPYSVVSLIPYDSYARKIIGYLYAIQHGATYIYDSDDDNKVLDDPMHTFTMVSRSTGLVVNTDQITYNPYPHFGQSTLWPRGYPLERLTSPSSHSYQLCQLKTPAVQQGLADRDPDVDSTLRLTRYTPDAQFHFDSASPPIVVPKGTFLPFNTQNTMFLYQAFWSLFLPMSVTFRTCDIYRGYWAQPLMWLLDQSIGFYPANVVHERNAHSYILDAKDEVDFLRMGDLVEHLRNWRCSKMHFFACASDLAWELVKEGYWNHQDGDLLESWLADLAMVSYIPPALKDDNRRSLCYSPPLEVIFYPQEQNTSIISNGVQRVLPGTGNEGLVKHFIHSMCRNHASYVSSIVSSSLHFKEVLLIISIPSSDSIPIYESLYRTYFPNILYCGPGLSSSGSQLVHQWRVSYISVTERLGVVSCVSTALKLGIRVGGYLYLPHNAILLPDSLPDVMWNQLWLTHDLQADTDPELDSRCQKGALKCQVFSRPILAKLSEYINKLEMGSKFKAKLKGCFNRFALDPLMKKEARYLGDIVFYLPKRLVNIFKQLSTVYVGDVQHDIITVWLLECLEPTPQYLAFNGLQGAPRNNLHYTFPVEAKRILDKEEAHVNYFCTAFSS